MFVDEVVSIVVLVVLGLLLAGFVGFIIAWRDQKSIAQQAQLEVDEIEAELEKLTSEKHEQSLNYTRVFAQKEASDQRSTVLEQELQELENKLSQMERDLQIAREEAEEHEKHHDISKTELRYEKEKLHQLKADYEEQKTSLKNEFKALSERILKQKQKELQKKSNEGMDAILAPLKEEIKVFKERVEKVHGESKEGQGALKEQLASLKKMNSDLSQRAENLALALRNDKKTVGNWGEIQLERLLENAGLDKNTYRREANYKTAEGANQRPDFIIDLPDQKTLIIDSKVSLNAYVDAANAETEEKRLASMKELVTNMRNHIKRLSDKDYDSLEGLNTPDFIFMFMPIESAYIAAFEEDASLFDYAYDKKVAVVTPNTLLPILRTVHSLWRIDKQNKSTIVLAVAAEKLHAKLLTFLEKFVDIGKKVESLNKSFNDAKTTLDSGRGNLVKMAENFKELGVKTQKEIPSEFEEQAPDIA